MTSPLGEAVYKYNYKYENGKFHIVSRTAAIVKSILFLSHEEQLGHIEK